MRSLLRNTQACRARVIISSLALFVSLLLLVNTEVVAKKGQAAKKASAAVPVTAPAVELTAASPIAQATPLPAAVTFISPVDGDEVDSAEIEVRLSVVVPEGSTLLGLRALIDGRLAAQSRGIGVTSAAVSKDAKVTHTLKVPLPPHNSILSVFAETSPTKSQLASVRLRWKGAGTPTKDNLALQPKLYLLAIGVSDYKRPELRLRFAAKDAADTAAAFRAQAKALYRSVDVKLLSDSQATKSNILDGLEWLQRQTTAKDVAVLFLAGHGVTDPSTGGYYFLPHDAEMESMKRTMIPESEIRETLSAIAGKVILFLDSCHSGKVFSATQTRAPESLSGLIGQLASAESGVVVFAASTSRQSSQEATTWNNGAFTKALIEGLSGRADYKKSGHVTINMLDLYISDRVKELTSGMQTPTTAKPATISDFPIAVVRDILNEDVDLAH